MICKKLATRGGLRAFPVSTIGDTGCFATPCRASQCCRTSDQNATIWRRVLLNQSTGLMSSPAWDPESAHLEHSSSKWCMLRLVSMAQRGRT